MRNPARTPPCVLLLTLLCLLLLSGCTRADPSLVNFDVAAQPAASGLNEFARQADIALIFSYDGVAGLRTRALAGRHTVDDGLRHLLADTGLDYRRLGDGSYLVCQRDDCGSNKAAQRPARSGMPAGREIE